MMVVREEAAINAAYVGPREDVLRLIANRHGAMLDVGCSTGSLGSAYKAKVGARVVGIEISEQMAEVARRALDKVVVGDALEVLCASELGDERFEIITFADSLEHMVDPWATLRAAKRWLIPGGIVIASLPNVGHLDTVVNLLFRRRWPYRDRGIHDRTHLRFFTRKNAIELFKDTGFHIERITANYRIVERPSRLNRLAPYLAVPGFRSFVAFQYLIRASAGRDSVATDICGA